jgi:hypothetical protein
MPGSASWLGTMSDQRTSGVTRRAAPPRSASERSHWPPGSISSPSPQVTLSPEKITIGVCSRSAIWMGMLPCSGPTELCRNTAGSSPVALW